MHWAVHVHDDRYHDNGVHQIGTVGDSAEGVEELAGQHLVYKTCRHTNTHSL